jgi:hypothetical protein
MNIIFDMKYVLLICCIVQGVYFIYVYLEMTGEVEPSKLKSVLFPGWWLDTENLTKRGKSIRNKYILHFFISIALVILTLISFFA